jgi:hypothetical protein
LIINRVGFLGFDDPPPIDVRGRVVNEQGDPVVGASVTVKGDPTKGTTTNENGDFVLRGVDDNATLVISATNIDRLEIPVRGRADLATLTARVKESPLDEVQIIAYGKTSKRYQTGNVTTVKAADIAKQPVNNPLLALQGRVPGLFIEQGSGVSGSGVKVRIQGQNSMANGKTRFMLLTACLILRSYYRE